MRHLQRIVEEMMRRREEKKRKPEKKPERLHSGWDRDDGPSR